MESATVAYRSPSLLDYRTQETYFNTIRARCRETVGTLKAQEDDDDTLATKLGTMSLGQHGKATDSASKEALGAASTVTATPDTSRIIMGMRKLREAIVASARNDPFARAAYVFIIRRTILWGQPESYHPALLHLLRLMHPVMPLSKAEEKEFVGYFLLDLACRQRDFATAFRIRKWYHYRVETVDMVLAAMVHGDWVLFGSTKQKAGMYERRLMGWADESMASHAVQCLGKSYLSLPRCYVERCTGMSWEKLRELMNLSWKLDGEMIVIKHINKR